MLELAGVFATSFIAATLVPLPSEAALFAYVRANPEHAGLGVAIATLGNTAGGMTTYLIGRLFPEKKILPEKAMRFVRRFGAPATLFAWLPVVGDGLALAAGWLRVHWLGVLGFMAAGRLARYIAVAFLSL